MSDQRHHVVPGDITVLDRGEGPRYPEPGHPWPATGQRMKSGELLTRTNPRPEIPPVHSLPRYLGTLGCSVRGLR